RRELRIVNGDERVRDHRGEGHARVEEAEVPRMRDLDVPGPDHTLDVFDHVGERHGRVEGIARCEVLPDLLRRNRGPDRSARNSRFQGLHDRSQAFDGHQNGMPTKVAVTDFAALTRTVHVSADAVSQPVQPLTSGPGLAVSVTTVSMVYDAAQF